VPRAALRSIDGGDDTPVLSMNSAYGICR